MYTDFRLTNKATDSYWLIYVQFFEIYMGGVSSFKGNMMEKRKEKRDKGLPGGWPEILQQSYSI